MRRIWLLAAGVILAGSAQLRLFGPLGPGEAVLAVWIVTELIAQLRHRRTQSSPLANAMLIFWGLTMFLMIVGWFNALFLGYYTGKSSWHDFLAYVLASWLSCLFAFHPYDREGDLSTARAVLAFASAFLLPLLAWAMLVGPMLGPIQVWFSYNLQAGVFLRFQGASTNPNQLALLVSFLPFLAMYLRSLETNRLVRMLYLVAALGMIAAGVISLSDALMLGWGGAVVVMLAQALFFAPMSLRARSGLLAGLIVGGVLTLLFALTVGRDLNRAYEDLAMKEGGQANVRVLNWTMGYRAVEASNFIGLGPGAHSGYYKPFGGFEAHCTPIDWATNVGIVGACLLLGLLLWIWCELAAGEGRNPWLLGGFSAIIMFSVLHHVVRHPVFWFYVCLAARLAHLGAHLFKRNRRRVGEYAATLRSKVIP